MNAPTLTDVLERKASPFDLDDDASYRRWRATKLARRARSIQELIVDVADPLALSGPERDAIVQRCALWNMAVYRCPEGAPQGKEVARALGRQLGLHRLDANWLADGDGISSIAVGQTGQDKSGFIPYTERPLGWHTDGYYRPAHDPIRAMLLHCVRPAVQGGANALLDHELAYIALRDASSAWARALCESDAMTVPAREDEGGLARPAQAGPVFSVDAQDGALHMRYTARTRSIAWKQDAATRGAVAFLERLLAQGNPDLLLLRLEAGMGIVANNLLHARSAFVDDLAKPRLLYRARYLDRVAQEATCRNG